eukprot:scaffold505936_cov23-Prasinocladus_malaysianus.AAC.1
MAVAGSLYLSGILARSHCHSRAIRACAYLVAGMYNELAPCLCCGIPDDSDQLAPGLRCALVSYTFRAIAISRSAIIPQASGLILSV